jgi:hypothetical protein
VIARHGKIYSMGKISIAKSDATTALIITTKGTQYNEQK